MARRIAIKKLKSLTETQEQIRVINYTDLKRIPCYHIANEGRRDLKTGAINKLKGVRKGMLDLNIPVSRKNFHSLYLEMKRTDQYDITLDQLKWYDALMLESNLVVFCRGHEVAMRIIDYYFDNKKTLNELINLANKLNQEFTDNLLMAVSKCCKSDKIEVVQVIEDDDYYSCLVCNKPCDILSSFKLTNTDVDSQNDNESYTARIRCA